MTIRKCRFNRVARVSVRSHIAIQLLHLLATPLHRSMLKPEHLFQPRRLLSRWLSPPDRLSATATLAFGFELDVMPNDLMSNSVRRNGMFDITTAETLYRLLDDGEDALDVGAHVGLMSMVMALRARTVRSFEPHPD